MDHTDGTFASDLVIALLDIIVVLHVEDHPVMGIALLALLKTVTNDRLLRILFILFIIVVGSFNFK
ncbi:hypothetical protein [Bacillus sp. REN3]|uniref:hypothetical protein n=1 Tax=Bacillus sp. REN3 TaxID=2802440 RepID=UPI001AEE1C80|nr:hypothetical protein [Bacillus sp. REN3]